MTSSKIALFSSAIALVLLGTPAVAHAQRSAQDLESARQLYNQGIELKNKGDLPAALEKFRAAHALGNTPLTGIELCRAYAALHQPVEAREICLSVARIPPTAQETSRSQDARNEAGRIAEAEKPKIASLRIKITGVPAGDSPAVTVDGAPVPSAALGELRAVNPGAHAVTARVGTGPETKGTVEVKEGEALPIELVVQPPPPGSEPAKPKEPAVPGHEPAQKSGANTLPIVLFSLAGVAAVIGSVGGLKAISGESDLSRECVNKQCGRELHDDLDSARTWGTVSTVSFVIAGVLGAGGLVALLTGPGKSSPSSAKPHVTPLIGLGGAGLHGSF